MDAQIVIIGAGQAGVEAADSLRSAGFTGSIVLISDEVGNPYQRPQLSKEFLSADDLMDPLAIRPLSYLQERNVDVITGSRACDLDLRTRTVTLDDDRELGYDQLVLATGSRNRTLPIPGADLDGVHSLRTLTEATRLRAELMAAERVVVIGAGFIGLEVASAARNLGADVTVFDVLDRPMARVLSEPMSAYFAELHTADGVRLRLGEGVQALHADAGAQRVGSVTTSTGEVCAADLVVVGVGAVPETGLAQSAGLAVEDGIIVDQYLRTSDPVVYAVGDCARFPLHGVPHRLESVQNATDQGRYVARRIMGETAPYRDVPWFWSHQCGRKLQIAGLVEHPDEVLIRGDRGTGRFSGFCFKNGELVGVESVDRAADHIAARRLLASGVRLSQEHVAAEDFDLKAASRGQRANASAAAPA